jgi:hypothetical protein
MVMAKKDKLITIGIVSAFVVITLVGIVLYNKRFHIPKNMEWAKDKKTVDMITALHPKVRARVARIFTKVEKELGIVLKGTSGLRDHDKQASLNFKNPSNATAGLSDHEYGFALDVNAYRNGKLILRKASSKQAWINSKIVKIFKDDGFKWGGDFNSYHDPIHFYDDFDIPAQEMAHRKTDNKGYIKDLS